MDVLEYEQGYINGGILLSVGYLWNCRYLLESDQSYLYINEQHLSSLFHTQFNFLSRWRVGIMLYVLCKYSIVFPIPEWEYLD